MSEAPAAPTGLDAAASAFETAFRPLTPRLREQAHNRPAAPRAVWLDARGHPLGSIEPALAQALASAGLPWCPAHRPGLPTPAFPGATVELPAWQVGSDTEAADLSDALQRSARWLNAQGLGGRWRGEALAVTDPAGAEHARIERAAVRPLGIITFAVHLVGYTADPDGHPLQWLQQRALDKATDPGLWDTLMGGQRGAGETPSDSLERETWEEAGLRLEQLRGLRATGLASFERPVSDGWLVEHIDLFEAWMLPGTTPVNQDGEVARFEAVDPAEAVRRVAAGEVTLEAAVMMARDVVAHIAHTSQASR